MFQGTLYLLAGASLYAAAQRLGAGLQRSLPGNLYTLMYLMLAVAAASMAAGATPTLALGVPGLLWILLPWLTLTMVQARAGIEVDLLTAAWISLLAGRLLIDTGRTDPYWNQATITILMLVTLAWCAVVAVRAPGATGRPLARRYLYGLLLLAVSSLGGALTAIPLFPFGFLLFLLLTERLELSRAGSSGPAVLLEQIPPRTVKLTLDRIAAEEPVPQVPARRSPATGHRPPPVPPPAASGMATVHAVSEVPRKRRQCRESGREEKDRGRLVWLADDLMDITVYASLALRRMKGENADPERLGALLRRIRSRAIEAHREANRLSRPEDVANHLDPER